MYINQIQPVISPSEKMPMEPPVPVTPMDKIGTAQKSKSYAAGDPRQTTRAREEEQNRDRMQAEEMKQLAEEMNDIMDDFQTSLGFSIREELNNQVVVEIKNRQTDELIKQIPAEELLAIKEKMEELTGLLFDQSV